MIKVKTAARLASAALRFTFVVAAYLVSTAHSSGFARLVRLRRRAFYFAISILTFYESIKIGCKSLRSFIAFFANCSNGGNKKY